jgi:hypothetical protein
VEAKFPIVFSITALKERFAAPEAKAVLYIDGY